MKTDLNHKFSTLEMVSYDENDSDMMNYCNMSSSGDYDQNAVIASFVGDYKSAVHYATLASNSENLLEITNHLDEDMIALAIAKHKSITNDTSVSEKERWEATVILDLLARDNDLTELFKNYKAVSALEFIKDMSQGFHFTFINEAHYSSQNRSFTEDLLTPLWEIGYRYLALEGLGYDDPEINITGFPSFKTGYYTKESSYGNLIRMALKLGYRLVPYETKSDHDGMLREKDQANNILAATINLDTLGKVLVHAGYSHINENGDSNFEPMAMHIKRITNQEIFTIEQQKMQGLDDSSKIHPYYAYASKKYSFKQPVVFINEDGESLVNPSNAFGIDIQIYHPTVQYVRGRPEFRKKKHIHFIDLPSEFLRFKNHLVRAIPIGESDYAIPIDQFIINNQRSFLLPEGRFKIEIINCMNRIVGVSRLSIY